MSARNRELFGLIPVALLVTGGFTAVLLTRRTNVHDVTVVYGLPRHAAFLQQLTHDLKRACGTGGTTIEDGIELQGDLRDRVRDLLRKRGFVVKG